MDLTKRKQVISLTLSPDAVQVIRTYLGETMSLSAFVDSHLCEIATMMENTGFMERAASARTPAEFHRLQAEVMEALEKQNPELDKLQAHKGGKE